MTLTASNAGGASAPVSQDVTVSAAAPDIDTALVDNTPVNPDIAALSPQLSAIVAASSADFTTFAVVGGRSLRQDSFLQPFGDGDYTLAGAVDLQPTLGYFSATTLPTGENSFARVGAAVDPALLAADFANGTATAADCNPDETVLGCELRLTNAGVVLIGIGYRDARDSTDLAQFQANLGTVVDEALNAGVVPVLMTVYPRPGEEDAMKRLSAAVILVAQDKQVPVLNIYRLLAQLPQQGLTDNDPSVAPDGADFIDDAVITQYGENARHFALLRTLGDLIPLFP